MTKIIEADDPRLTFVPIEEASKAPKGLCEHIVGYWWVCHPEKGLLFYKANKHVSAKAQGNGNEEIAKQVASLIYPWAEVKFVESVFIKVDVRDYIE